MTVSYHFDIYEDKKGEFRARFIVDGIVSFSTAGYANKVDVYNTIRSIQKHGPKAKVEDNS